MTEVTNESELKRVRDYCRKALETDDLRGALKNNHVVAKINGNFYTVYLSQMSLPLVAKKLLVFCGPRSALVDTVQHVEDFILSDGL